MLWWQQAFRSLQPNRSIDILQIMAKGSKDKEFILKLLTRAGIAVNGTDPRDIQIHNEDFYPRVFRQLYLGLGESYMDGWWDAERLDEFFFKTIRADLEDELKNWRLAFHFIK